MKQKSRNQAIEIGRTEQGAPVRLNIAKLIETGLLIEAMRGGGKSWTQRRLLEQTHGHIQQIVIDPEGEYPSLREKFDYVLIGKGGDRAAKPKEAGALALSVLELQCNVICDLYELTVPERKRFVRLFLESLIEAPKKLWHPVLVVIDEAHTFCPQNGEAESAEAIIELLSRGRKRGDGIVLGTQRPAKLNKNAAAECGNVMVGRVFQDIDRARALDILAVSRDRAREIDRALMTLPAGSFYSIGEAFYPQVLTFFRVGPVRTKHPQVGQGQLVAPAPPPSARIRAVLDKLDHISREKEEEAAEVVTLRSRVNELTRQITRLEREANTQKPALATGFPLDYIQRRDIQWEARLTKSQGELARAISSLKAIRDGAAKALVEVLRDAPTEFKAIDPLPAITREPGGSKPPAVVDRQLPPKPSIERQTPPPACGNKIDSGVDNGYHPRAGARRMLEALARYHQGSMTAAQLRTYARLRKSGTSDTYLSELKRHGLIEEVGDALRITQAGLEMVGADATQPLTTEEVIGHWREVFRAGARRMLDVLVDDRGQGMTREELGERVGMEPTSGTFGTYLGELKRNGLAVIQGGLIKLSEDLRT